MLDRTLTSPSSGLPIDATCSTNEQTISWNQNGPQGLPGPQGVTGTAGVNGQPGAVGPAGPALIGETQFGLNAGGSRMFLKLDGINGESLDKHYKEDIAISSFSLGALNGGSKVSAGGGGGAGKVALGEFQITKLVDKTSSVLYKDAVMGTHIKSATLFCRKAGGTQSEFLEYKLKDVVVAKISQGVDYKERSTESVSFTFAKMNVEFIGTTSSGKTLRSPSLTFTITGNAVS